MFLGVRIHGSFFTQSEVSCPETLSHILLLVVKTFSFKIKIKQITLYPWKPYSEY